MSKKAFKEIMNGLEQAIAHARGEITLKTTFVKVEPRPCPSTGRGTRRHRG